MNGALALLFGALAAGGCAVETHLADATGGASGDGSGAGAGRGASDAGRGGGGASGRGSRANETGGAAGSGVGGSDIAQGGDDNDSGGTGAVGGDEQQGGSGGGDDQPGASGGASGAGPECRDVEGYPTFPNNNGIRDQDWCMELSETPILLGCTTEPGCIEIFTCGKDPKNGQRFGFNGCLPDGWDYCDEQEEINDCEGGCFDGTLETFCDEFECPASLEEAVENARAGEFCDKIEVEVTRFECGYSRISTSTGFTGSTYTFLDETGELVMASKWSDEQFGSCSLFSYDGGEELNLCDTESTCSVCGPPDNTKPEPCEPN